MNDTTILHLFHSFKVEGEILQWAPYGNGHINDTILVQTTPELAPDFILQRKNHKIFKNVPGMLDNIVKATDHIRRKLISQGIKDTDRRVMKYFLSKSGRMFVNDSEGNFWTLFLFIPDSRGIEQIENPEQVYDCHKRTEQKN